MADTTSVDVEDHLQQALAMADHAATRYHIRQALQMTQLDRRPE